MRLRGRLKRLERGLAADAGCTACRDRRGLVVLVGARQLADGSVVEEEDGPAACARCGEVPEQVLQIVEVVVEGWEDVARLKEAGLLRPADTER
jgi:hypothetical protein